MTSIDPADREVPLTDALLLGIQGSDADANAHRAQRAQALVAEAAERSDRAYLAAAAARTSQEPTVEAAPFGASLVAAEDGDLARVVTSPEFLREFERQHGAASREVLVDDEDGLRYEVEMPSNQAVAAAQVDADRVRAEVVARAGITPPQLEAARETHAARARELDRRLNEDPSWGAPASRSAQVQAGTNETSLSVRLEAVQTKVQQRDTLPAATAPARHDLTPTHQQTTHGPRL